MASDFERSREVFLDLVGVAGAKPTRNKGPK